MHKYLFKLSKEVKDGLDNNKSVVALESTLISHGLPFPKNINVAKLAISAVRKSGSIPATIGIIKGKIIVGLNNKEIQLLANKKNEVEKVSINNLANSINNKKNAATTVASSIYIASKLGIKFFATGGIGGVHLNAIETFDISSDLIQMSKTNINIICSGPKSILDIDKTYEYLETLGISRVGYNTNYMPGFWYNKTNKKLDFNYKSLSSLKNYLNIRDNLNLNTSVLIFNPVKQSKSINKKDVEYWISISLQKAIKNKINGKELTPFLINEINKLSKNKTLNANIDLIINNALLAGKIAKKYFS